MSSLSVCAFFNINLKIRFLIINDFLIRVNINNTRWRMISIIFSILINITVFEFLFRDVKLLDVVYIALFFNCSFNIGLFLWVYNLSERWSRCFNPTFNFDWTSSVSFYFKHILIILRLKLINYIVFNILFVFQVNSCLLVVIYLRWFAFFMFFIHFIHFLW